MLSVPNNKLHMYVDEHFGSSSPTPRSLSAPRDKIPQWISAYSRILLETEKGPSMGDSTDLLLRPLIPMLCFNMFSIREKCDWIRENYDQSINHLNSFRNATQLEDLFSLRNDLRRTVERSEDTLDQIPRFLNSNRIWSLQQRTKPSDQPWIGNEIKKVHLEAHRLEIELRDYLQLQTGVVAIDESRKSIQLSNLQIEEGKRMKTFTMLAFVYVPLNLATSVFGMNLEQLNGSGQHLRVFIVTAVILLAVTGTSWSMIEQINSYRKWHQRSLDETYDGQTQFAIAVRLALLLWLVSQGYTSWMFTSGVWWRIATNHKSRMVFSRGSYLEGEFDGRLNACEGFSKLQREGRSLSSIKLEGMGWTSVGNEHID
ncbi:hypothetical protein BDR22DRAFT_191798 [Usnea florida]